MLKEGEEHKSKIYRCVVFSERTLVPQDIVHLNERFADGCTPLSIDQRTPIRVMQRRANCARQKHIFRLTAQYVDASLMIVHIHAQAGTYKRAHAWRMSECIW